MVKKRKKRHIFSVMILFLAIILILAGLLIKFIADWRTKDFFIDNYIMGTGLYETKEEASENIIITEKIWGDNYCVSAIAYSMYGTSKISTTIVMEVPTWQYVFNMRSAKVKMVGECS